MEARIITEFPGAGGPISYFDRGRHNTDSGKDGLLVEFIQGSQKRLACFAFGYDHEKAVTGIFQLNSTSVFVVSRGSGFLIADYNFKQVIGAPLFPIVQKVESPSEGVVYFGSFDSVTALTLNGLTGKTRVCSDNLRLEMINTQVWAYGWNASEDRETRQELRVQDLMVGSDKRVYS
jgi:hypothetical protein